MSNQITEERVIELARQTLDVGLCLDKTARITRATDAEIIAFAKKLLAEAGFQLKRGEEFARILDTGKRHGSGVPDPADQVGCDCASDAKAKRDGITNCQSVTFAKLTNGGELRRKVSQR